MRTEIPYRVVEPDSLDWFPKTADDEIESPKTFELEWVAASKEYRIMPKPELSLKERYAQIWSRCAPRKPFGPPQSPSEEIFLRACKRLKVPVHAQQVASEVFATGRPFVADFAYYDPVFGIRVALEIDGGFKFDSSGEVKHMANRDQYFKKAGWYVFRFHASDCNDHPEFCLSQALRLIKAYAKKHQDILEDTCGAVWRKWAEQLLRGAV